MTYIDKAVSHVTSLNAHLNPNVGLQRYSVSTAPGPVRMQLSLKLRYSDSIVPLVCVK